jgi:hypothetical protein
MRAEPDPVREPPVTIRKRPAVAAGLPAIYQTVRFRCVKWEPSAHSRRCCR